METIQNFPEITKKDFPLLNCSIDNDRIIHHKNINMGVAVALPDDNLIVPVIHESEEKNLTLDLLDSGLWIFLRGGNPSTPWHSLPEAIKAITEMGASNKRVCVCTDDRDAHDIFHFGLDWVVRQATKAGINKISSWSMGSLHPAHRYILLRSEAGMASMTSCPVRSRCNFRSKEPFQAPSMSCPSSDRYGTAVISGTRYVRQAQPDQYGPCAHGALLSM